jgi:hypothetical protein
LKPGITERAQGRGGNSWLKPDDSSPVKTGAYKHVPEARFDLKCELSAGYFYEGGCCFNLVSGGRGCDVFHIDVKSHSGVADLQVVAHGVDRSDFHFHNHRGAGEHRVLGSTRGAVHRGSLNQQMSGGRETDRDFWHG